MGGTAIRARYWAIALAIIGLALTLWQMRVVRHVSRVNPAATAALRTEPEMAAEAVAALGRLEPKDRAMKIAGPSRQMTVVSKLFVKEGDIVQEGQILAVLDSYTVQKATVARLKAELKNTNAEYRRNECLYKNNVVSVSDRETWKTRVAVARANFNQAVAELKLDLVCAPISGQVLEIHTYAGERVGIDGICEIGKTDEMHAVAEVYETDIAQVRVGQRASITSPAFTEAIEGTVERIAPKVNKRDVLGTDPATNTNARVVEVYIRLDDSRRAASLTNLQVEVRIHL